MNDHRGILQVLLPFSRGNGFFCASAKMEGWTHMVEPRCIRYNSHTVDYDSDSVPTTTPPSRSFGRHGWHVGEQQEQQNQAQQQQQHQQRQQQPQTANRKQQTLFSLRRFFGSSLPKWPFTNPTASDPDLADACLDLQEAQAHTGLATQSSSRFDPRSPLSLPLCRWVRTACSALRRVSMLHCASPRWIVRPVDLTPTCLPLCLPA